MKSARLHHRTPQLLGMDLVNYDTKMCMYLMTNMPVAGAPEASL